MNTTITARFPVPMCPAWPEAWTAEIHQAARDHTAEVYPLEAAGIVEGGQYVRLDNISRTPDADVFLSDADLLRVADADVFFHSHPDGLGSPSQTDMVYQIQLGIPFVVMVWPVPDTFCWGDMLKPAPLVGRGFRHGVHDCCSLIRDFFREQGIEFHDGPRDWEWWTKGQDLYTENFERAGFVRIDPATATQRGDLVLMNFNNKVPMHGAVVLDQHLLLHHAAGVRAVDSTRLSAAVPRVRYTRHFTMGLRRK
jgi:proteasome lid subunit RPN8/RPN11